MYSPRLYKSRGSYILYKPTVQTFGTVNWHTLFWYRHTHMTFPPPGEWTVGNQRQGCPGGIFNEYVYPWIIVLCTASGCTDINE